jgi:hypothetical protein
MSRAFACGSIGSSVPKMNENAPKIAIVFLDPVVERPNMRLVQKAQNMLLELTAAFTWNDFYQGNPLRDRLLDNPVQLFIDLLAAIVDIV